MKQRTLLKESTGRLKEFSVNSMEKCFGKVRGYSLNKQPRISFTTKLCLQIMLLFSVFIAEAQEMPSATFIQVDLTKKTSEKIKPIWAWFGYDEANYTYMKDGKKL